MIWVQNNQITPLCLGPEQPNNSVIWLFWTQTKWSYLVVVDPDKVELFGCSGPRSCGIIWLFWTKKTWSHLVVLNPDHMELFGCSRRRSRAVIWLLWTQTTWSYLVVVDPDKVDPHGLGPQPNNSTWSGSRTTK
jgi:hypothetical protein